MAAIVIVDEKVNEFYLHEVVIEKQNEDVLPFKTEPHHRNDLLSDNTSYIYTLLKKLQNVNIKKFI